MIDGEILNYCRTLFLELMGYFVLGIVLLGVVFTGLVVLFLFSYFVGWCVSLLFPFSSSFFMSGCVMGVFLIVCVLVAGLLDYYSVF